MKPCDSASGNNIAFPHWWVAWVALVAKIPPFDPFWVQSIRAEAAVVRLYRTSLAENISHSLVFPPAVVVLDEIWSPSMSASTDNFQDEKVQNIPLATNGRNTWSRSFLFPVMVDSDFWGRKNSPSASFHTGSAPPGYCGKPFIQQGTGNKSRCSSMGLIPEVTGHLISHLDNSGLCIEFFTLFIDRSTTAWH